MENAETGDARISGTCASLCGLESALAAADATETELALRRIELLYALVCSLVGIPMVFSGDELALRNDYSWEKDPTLAEDNRWMHRPLMDWAAAERRHSEGTIEARIFGHIRTCLEKRRHILAFAADAPFEVLPSPSENVLICRRSVSDRAAPNVLVVANFAPEHHLVPLPALPGAAGGVRELLHDSPLVTEGDSVALDAYAVLWIEIT